MVTQRVHMSHTILLHRAVMSIYRNVRWPCSTYHRRKHPSRLGRIESAVSPISSLPWAARGREKLREREPEFGGAEEVAEERVKAVILNEARDRAFEFSSKHRGPSFVSPRTGIASSG